MTGTAAPALYGLCESQYNPNLTAEELVQTAGVRSIFLVLKYVFVFSFSFCQLIRNIYLWYIFTEKCFRAALQRDVMSGGSVRIYTLTKDSIYLKEVSSNDI